MQAVPIIDLSGADEAATAAALGRACRESGFFVAAGHGVPARVVDRMFDQMRLLFALPLEDKMKMLQARARAQARACMAVPEAGGRPCDATVNALRGQVVDLAPLLMHRLARSAPRMAPNRPSSPGSTQDENNRGYTPMAEETLDPEHQTRVRGRAAIPPQRHASAGPPEGRSPTFPKPRRTARGAPPTPTRAAPATDRPRPLAPQGDTKEGFYFGREVPAGSPEAELPLHGPNVWPPPALLPGFRPAVEEYFREASALGHRLLRLLALSLGLAPGHFDRQFDPPMAFLRPLRYAPEKSSPGEGVFGAGAHSDYVGAGGARACCLGTLRPLFRRHARAPCIGWTLRAYLPRPGQNKLGLPQPLASRTQPNP
jgi:isopenicillin N synthase-like dioxygenase